MNPIEKLYDAHPEPAAYATAYLRHLNDVLQSMDAEAIAAAVEAIWEARQAGKRIFFVGNGGSAATASHMANDFGLGTRTAGAPFKALALTDNNAVMTCIANDWGYDDVFVKQLELHLEPGDLLIAISASGNSPNVVKAIEFANARGNTTIGMSGFDGGKLRELSTIKVHVPSEKGEYGPVEDAHMVLDHLMSTFLTMRARARG